MPTHSVSLLNLSLTHSFSLSLNHICCLSLSFSVSPLAFSTLSLPPSLSIPISIVPSFSHKISLAFFTLCLSLFLSLCLSSAALVDGEKRKQTFNILLIHFSSSWLLIQARECQSSLDDRGTDHFPERKRPETNLGGKVRVSESFVSVFWARL